MLTSYNIVEFMSAPPALASFHFEVSLNHYFDHGIVVICALIGVAVLS